MRYCTQKIGAQTLVFCPYRRLLLFTDIFLVFKREGTFSDNGHHYTLLKRVGFLPGNNTDNAVDLIFYSNGEIHALRTVERSRRTRLNIIFISSESGSPFVIINIFLNTLLLVSEDQSFSESAVPRRVKNDPSGSKFPHLL